jgi:hypothetical protein
MWLSKTQKGRAKFLLAACQPELAVNTYGPTAPRCVRAATAFADTSDPMLPRENTPAHSARLVGNAIIGREVVPHDSTASPKGWIGRTSVRQSLRRVDLQRILRLITAS